MQKKIFLLLLFISCISISLASCGEENFENLDDEYLSTPEKPAEITMSQEEIDEIFEKHFKNKDFEAFFSTLFINESGIIEKANTLFDYSRGKSTKVYKQSAISALKEIKFKPAENNEKKVKTQGLISVIVQSTENGKRRKWDLKFRAWSKYPSELPTSKAKDDLPDILKGINFFVEVEDMPAPIGGIEGIQQKIKYPEIAKRAAVEGRVFIKAFIDSTGKVVHTSVIKGIGAGCDEAAIEAIKQTKFKPGRQRGEPVNVQVSVPVLFKLQ